VIVRNFNIFDIAIFETKTHTPLNVNTNAPLAFAIPFKGFEPIAGRNPQIINASNHVELLQLSTCGLFNVSKARNPSRHEIPTALESILGAFDIMQASALAEKMKYRKPDIYVHPEILGVRMLDFRKIEEVFLEAAPAVDVLRKQLKSMALKKGHSSDP